MNGKNPFHLPNPHHPTPTGDSWAGGLEREIPVSNGADLIVCPRSGLLRAADLPRVRQHKTEQEAKEAAEAAAKPPTITLDPETDLQRINDICYLVTYATLPEPSPMGFNGQQVWIHTDGAIHALRGLEAPGAARAAGEAWRARRRDVMSRPGTSIHGTAADTVVTFSAAHVRGTASAIGRAWCVPAIQQDVRPRARRAPEEPR
jgi:hypothetical protein